MKNKVFEAAENAVRSFGGNVLHKKSEGGDPSKAKGMIVDLAITSEQLIEQMEGRLMEMKDNLQRMKERMRSRLDEISDVISGSEQTEPAEEIPMERGDSMPGELQYHLSFHRGADIEVYDPMSGGYKCGRITRPPYFKPDSQWTTVRGTWMVDIVWCCTDIYSSIEACRVLYDGDRFPDTEDEETDY